MGVTETVIKYEKKRTNGKTDITVTDEVKINAGTQVKVLVSIPREIDFYPNADGKANLYLDEKDKTKLYVNYFLNATNEVPAGIKIKYHSPKYDCDKDVAVVMQETKEETLSLPRSF